MPTEVPIFYTPPEMVHDADQIRLPHEESAHAARVMRRQVGDVVEVVDGEGGWYRVRLSHVTRTVVRGTILERQCGVNEPEAPLRIGIAMLNSRHRFAMLLEKVVEVGVTDILPLHTRHSGYQTIRPDRGRRVMIAALKQCRRSMLPQIHALQSFKDLLAAPMGGLRCIAHMGGTTPLAQVVAKRAQDPIIILIGPESGFTQTEIDRAYTAGYAGVSLGARRLRSETAAIAAASMCTLLREADIGHRP